ncbi:MAG: hypothetical protein LBU27_09195 [Candidatus Peribacteria bacterium]|jgi:hypothetical protein|nr:hypothetical protein [Candidatus Peribacteria bacterium]
MNIVAPLKTNENGFAERLQLLDPRKISITVNPSGDETVNYNGKKLTDYKKTIFLPNPNRQGYGDCEFASAIDDAILDQATRATAIAFYKNDASP